MPGGDGPGREEQGPGTCRRRGRDSGGLGRGFAGGPGCVFATIIGDTEEVQEIFGAPPPGNRTWREHVEERSIVCLKPRSRKAGSMEEMRGRREF